MPVYRNVKSGVTFSTPCVCAGEDWEELKETGAPPPKDGSDKKKRKNAKTEVSDAKAELPDSESEPPDGGEDS